LNRRGESPAVPRLLRRTRAPGAASGAQIRARRDRPALLRFAAALRVGLPLST
jgi:hypothetical protein